jgi:hypothetical protein
MTTYVNLEGYGFSDDRRQAPGGHDNLLLSDEFGLAGRSC